MSTSHAVQERTHRPFAARWIHRLSIPIILLWVALTVVLTLFVPSLEQVEREHSVPLIAQDAPSTKAAERMGQAFSGSNVGTLAVIVLEGQEPLGTDAHEYYDNLVRQFEADTAHVQHVEDFWGDPLTAGAAQSTDGKAVYVQVSLVGATGSPQGNRAVLALQQIVERTPAPPGVKAYVTGPAAIVADMGESGNRTIILITLVTFAVIFIMLAIVFRSIITTIVILLTVLIELQVARGIVAFLGLHGLVGLTTFVVNLLVSVGIAAGTDYGIFFVGRYQEARQAGEDKETAYYITYRSVAKVVLASGVTIAGAIACLSFTRLPFFQPLGIPGAVGILVAVAVALTLVPAIMAAGGRFGMFDPKRRMRTHAWQRIGTATVRWPAPILVATLAVSLIGLLTLPGYHPSYNDQKFIPQDIPANEGYAAAARHFPESKLTVPDLLVLQSDHDMRNPADMLILNKLAKAVFAVQGVATVQSVTRPEGTQIDRTTIPFMISVGSASQLLNMPFQELRMDDMLEQANQMSKSIDIMKRMLALMRQMVTVTHNMVGTTHELQDVTEDLRDSLSDFDDFFRPIRNYFHWEPHCINIPICWSLRSLFVAFDGVDAITLKMEDLVRNLDQLDVLLPQMVAQIEPMIPIMESMRTMMLTMHATMSGTIGAFQDNSENATAMAKAFNQAKNDESFYLPPEIFENADFKRVMDIFMSPDGKSARMLISQSGDPATPEGMARVEPIRTAAEEALKGTPLETSSVFLAGTAATVKDLVDGSRYDLLIAGVAALCLIFIIMLLMTRSFIAALVIVGTVVISMGASFGLSILVWQHLLGIQIHWVVVAMSVIVLLAVGSDYNLMLVSRMKEEIGAGLNTGIIRAMGGTGRVVTAAGLVFAATMASMLVSDLLTIGQVGTTIAMGLLFDTMVVRAFMTPSAAALLGRWFWWPQRVRSRPASHMLRSVGPRPLVRSLLLRD
ncbi:RND family transporter [Mycobacterium barrassiae]|uniref:MMPL/RND family transporter n=1 Tax=Mycobacterium barrassiae TaxID=319709 RepID=UPI002265C7E2|nr:RND family transporter [Mycobacterium barrassiae]MCV7299510.1 RND family transporter [Mycobacterium barrassiae]